MRIIYCLILLLATSSLHSQQLQTAFEASGGRETFRYEEGIAFCETLDSISEYLELFTYGMTDAGKPLHLLVFDPDRNFGPVTNKEVILINNAIHPGEPDGVEASLMLARDLATDETLRKDYSGVRLLIIPFYNVGGALNRNTHSRVNQNGPQSYGFRGNARYYDLNRDFIKADAGNTFAFYTIFHTWNPHVLVDTHVSNGADYQYTMTLIATQEEKYGPEGSMAQKQLTTRLFERMDSLGETMVPYVNVFGQVPDSGFSAFNETPRYSNGYAALFGCLSFVAETHMLKPFPRRVRATSLFLHQVIRLSMETKPSIALKQDRALARAQLLQAGRLYSIEWILSETARPDSITFLGYEAGIKPSEVSGLPRLFYDRNKPYSKRIPFHDQLSPARQVPLPRGYIIPRQWQQVIDRLAANGVRFDTLKSDRTFVVYAGRILDFHTGEEPYEGHYLHSQTRVHWYPDTLVFRAGDLIALPDEKTEGFLATVLSPESPDSYFNWNFFDPILQQKEWFSSYVFEDIAAEILRKDPSLRRELEKRKAEDPAFASNAFEQLYFLYWNSPYFEPGYRQYPVYILPN